MNYENFSILNFSIIFQVKVGDGREFVFWIKPVKLGFIPLLVRTVTPQATDSLKRLIFIEVGF